MPTKHVNIKHVRESADFAAVLVHYEVVLEGKGPSTPRFPLRSSSMPSTPTSRAASRKKQSRPLGSASAHAA